MTREDAERLAGHYLSGPRLDHSLSVARLAADYGAVFGLPSGDLYIAGALHDIAKQMSPERQRALALDWHREHEEPAFCDNQALWHAAAAAALLEREHGMNNALILGAIARHTTGSRNMSRFDECLYAADFLDPVRYFPEQDDVRPLAARDFDAALLAMCRGTIISVVSRQRILDHASVDYYNDLLTRLAIPGRIPVGLAG